MKIREYPELLIIGLGADQYGERTNKNNLNPKYEGDHAHRDPFGFIEIVNNSTESVNIYDYMLAYQNAACTDTEYFESSIQKYTPFYFGEDLTDGPYTSYDVYWQNGGERPANPPYEGGRIAPGETFVVWVYNGDSHVLCATEKQFRAFWSIDDSVKVFVIDGFAEKNPKNFSLRSFGTSTYAIIHESERFPRRRSFDKTFYCENNNAHHNYEGETYETLDEVISFAVVDYRSQPLSDTDEYASRENLTLSFLPGEDSDTLKRVRLQKINSYGEREVGKLNREQRSALEKTRTEAVRTVPQPPVALGEVNGRPSLIITEISTDNYLDVPQNTNTSAANADEDIYECFEVYNNSDSYINIYDYMFGYQGSGAKNVSTYFERLIQEYTPLFPGKDWIDAPYTAYDSYWTDARRPENPEYALGALAPAEVAVVWCYNKEAHLAQAQIDQFRAFWNIPSEVKVFLLDGNSADREKNFNIKNNGTGTYVIMKPCEKYPRHRGDDETFLTDKGDRLSVYYDLHGGRSYETEPEIVSWAVVCYNVYEPLRSYSAENGGDNATNNFTLVYAPYNGERVYTNGFLTVSIPSDKRMHLQGIAEKAHIGVLTDEQKALIEQAKNK